MRNIVVAEDHPLFLKGICNHLKDNSYNVTVKATNGIDALHALKNNQPVLGILDIEMPKMSGLEVAKKVRENNIDARLIILSFHKEAEIINYAKALNVMGYIPKDRATAELIPCIESTMNNEIYFADEINHLVTSPNSPTETIKNLTPSEYKILRYISRGKSTSEIANHIHISIQSVEKYQDKIRKKLSTDNRIDNLTHWSHKNRALIKLIEENM